jgi:hypothetical protein
VENVMTAASVGDDGGTTVLDLRAVAGYLQAAGWSLEDQDARTSVLRVTSPMGADSLEIVLPVRQEVSDYPERIEAALRTLAYAEQRLPDEVRSDISSGGADTVAVKLTPDAPPGEAPLSLAHSAVSALHSFVVGSAAAIEIHELVLPSHRPLWAEPYAGRVRLSTQPGSFILNLALPLVADIANETSSDGGRNEQLAFNLPPQPFGRRVSTRMLRSAQAAQKLADEVSAGDRQLHAFGEDPVRPASNVIELAALKAARSTACTSSGSPSRRERGPHLLLQRLT